MQDLSIRGQEIENMKSQLKNLEEKKLNINNLYLVDLQNIHRLTQRIEQLENESAMVQTTAQKKENIWVEVNKTMTEIWPSKEIIFEHEELL